MINSNWFEVISIDLFSKSFLRDVLGLRRVKELHFVIVEVSANFSLKRLKTSFKVFKLQIDKCTHLSWVLKITSFC